MSMVTLRNCRRMKEIEFMSMKFSIGVASKVSKLLSMPSRSWTNMNGNLLRNKTTTLNKNLTEQS
jgi:hypothetical protein